MAVTKIWPVKGNIGKPISYVENELKTANPEWDKTSLQHLDDVIVYAANEDKTDKKYFVSGINCNADTARDQFVTVKKQFDKEDGIVAYHAIQSFDTGEVTPELAHRIGCEFAREVWGNEYQVVVATHLNTENIHNHFIINSVSFVHGRRCRAKQWYEINKINDDICRSYSLKVLEKPNGKGLPYNLHKEEVNGGDSRRNVARRAVDEAIAASSNMKEFEIALRSMGYSCNFDPKRKYWTIKASTWNKVMRLERLGEDYSNTRIRERIVASRDGKTFQTFQRALYKKRQYNLTTREHKIKKVGGIKGQYLRYCYMLGYLPKYKHNPARVSPLLKDDLAKLDRITDETRLLCRENITTDVELLSFKDKCLHRIDEAVIARDKLKNILRRNVSPEEKTNAQNEITKLNAELKTLRKNVKLVDGIAARSKVIDERINELEIREREVKENERKR